MCSTETLDQAEKARGLIKHFRLDIEESVAIRTFLLAASSASLTEAFIKGKSHLHNLIGNALLQRQLMLLMRLYDIESRDRACLARLFSLLRVSEVRQSITTDGGEPAIRAATELWDSLRNDPRKALLRAMRDTVSAHNLLARRPELAPITYDEFWKFSRDTEKLVEYLAFGSGVAAVSLDAVEKVWSERADEYWRQVTHRS